MKAIISGGGTGGHIFPAVAIANAIKARYADADILFIGAEGRMEMEKVPAAGYPIKGLPIAGLQRSLSPKNIMKNLAVPFKLLKSQSMAKKIIRNFNPDVVVGVGGYASAPTLKTAAKMGYPTLLQEQNSYPGLTNKMLSAHADVICVAYNGLEKFFPAEKIVFTGNPVRKVIEDMSVTKAEGCATFQVNPDKRIILSVGGSLGARTINETLCANLKYFIDNDIQLIWQTGKGYYKQAKEAVEAGNILQLHSLTKTYCIPGLRVGFVVGNAALVRELRSRLRPWSVNALAIEAAMWLLRHEVQVVPEYSYSGVPVKSTMIRTFIQVGELNILPSIMEFGYSIDISGHQGSMLRSDAKQVLPRRFYSTQQKYFHMPYWCRIRRPAGRS